MDPQTDSTQPEDVGRFYDRLAGTYDAMTGFETRLDRERPVFARLVDDYRIRTAVDAGAGTGFHSILLAQLAVDVTAVDISRRMLDALESRAQGMGLAVKAAAGSLEDLPSLVAAQVDAVFSLGNTLAHCLSPDALSAAVRGFRGVLRPGGLSVVQILNYRRILASREAIVNVKEADGCRFTRRYEFGERRVTFIIVQEDLAGREPPKEQRVELSPWLETDMESAFRASGFADIRLFGSISREPYDAKASKDVVLMAR